MIELDTIRLLPLLKNFYLLTGLNTAIYSSDMNEIVSFPGNSKFCNYIYKSPLNNICLNSNLDFCKSSHNNFSIKACPFALWDTVAPIERNGKIIGFMMIGQAQNSKNDADKIFNKQLTSLLQSNNLDVELLKKYYKELPSMDSEHIRACVEILYTCIDHLYSLNIIADKSNLFVQQVEQFIEEHITEDLTVETLCKNFYLSKSHLYRLSKKHLGNDISSYIRNKRLQLAKKLLIENKLTVSEIAVKVGIPDYNYFNKVFKKHMGISPSKFRNQNKK